MIDRTAAKRDASSSPPAYDVAVVGLGPVGITLTALLGKAGLRVLAVDAATDIYRLPRAMGMDHETMRVFQEIGLAERLEPVTSPYRSSEYRSSDGDVIRRFHSQEPPFPLAWPPYMTFLQPELEGFLRDHVARAPTVEMRLGTEARTVRNEGNGARLTLHEAGSDTASTGGEEIEARYVVGCDGGASPVRRALGIAFEDLDFDEPWVVIDMLVEDGVELPEVNVQFCDPARPHTFVVGPKNLRRWEFMIMPGEDPAEMVREESVWRLLQPWLRPGQARLWRAATYRFHALVAERWRDGSVLLAGDACHMTPPFLAQGMVQGIKDASNLAWKLKAVLSGAPDRLLDTYEGERRPLVRKVIAITKDLGGIICERDAQKALERNRRMLEAMRSGEGTTVRQDLLPALSGGALRSAAGATAVGRPSPQPVVAQGGAPVRLDDLTGAGARILARAGFGASRECREDLARLGIGYFEIGADALADVEGTFDRWMAGHDCRAIVVRPDHVVFAALREPAELPAAVQEFASWLAPVPQAVRSASPAA